MWLFLLVVFLCAFGWYYLATPQQERPQNQRFEKQKQNQNHNNMAAKKIEVNVPQDKMHLVVGKGGETIKKIRTETKTKITLPEKGSSSTKVVIEGM